MSSYDVSCFVLFRISNFGWGTMSTLLIFSGIVDLSSEILWLDHWSFLRWCLLFGFYHAVEIFFPLDLWFVLPYLFYIPSFLLLFWVPYEASSRTIRLKCCCMWIVIFGDVSCIESFWRLLLLLQCQCILCYKLVITLMSSCHPSHFMHFIDLIAR